MTIRHSGGIPFWSFKTKNSIFPVSGRFKPDNLKTFRPPTDRGNPNRSSTGKLLSFRVDITFYLRSFHPTSESGSGQVHHSPGQITPEWGPLTIDLASFPRILSPWRKASPFESRVFGLSSEEQTSLSRESDCLRNLEANGQVTNPFISH